MAKKQEKPERKRFDERHAMMALDEAIEKKQDLAPVLEKLAEEMETAKEAKARIYGSPEVAEE